MNCVNAGGIAWQMSSRDIHRGQPVGVYGTGGGGQMTRG